MTYQRNHVGDWELIDDEECRRTAGIVERVGRRWNSGILLAVARGAAYYAYAKQSQGIRIRGDWYPRFAAAH